MVTRQPAYNKKFRCLGGSCPDTCCRDWSIVPDEQSMEDYKNAPEPLKTLLAHALTTDDDGDPCFKLREDGFCVLLTGDGLCPIQRDWGEEHLCTHCGAYPRFTEEYGSLTETALAVSCPEAARLLMEAEDFALDEADDGVDDRPFDGVDGELLSALERSRKLALDTLCDRCVPIWERLARVVDLGDRLQDCLDEGDFEAMEACRVEEVGPLSGKRRETAAALMELCASKEALRPAWPALLEKRSQELWQLKKGYWELCAAYETANPGWDHRLAKLASYLVFRHWHKTVNDDGIYGRAAFVGGACLLVYHLCLLEWWEKGVLFPVSEQAIWSAFSREIEHMEETLTDLMEGLYQNEFWPILAALAQQE